MQSQLRLSTAGQVVRDIYREVSGTLHSILSKPRNMVKTGLAVLAINAGIANPAWANSQ